MHESYGNYYATHQLAAHYDADYACRPDIPFYLALAQELQAQVVVPTNTDLALSDMAIRSQFNVVYTKYNDQKK